MATNGITPDAKNDVLTSDDSVPNTKIQINISGTLFRCQQSLFSTFPCSRLANLATRKDNHFDTENKEYCFDKDPVIFNSILDAYRTGVIHAPSDVCGERFKQEVIFWDLPISNVAPCCLKVLHAADSNLSMMNQVTDAILQSVDVGFSSDGRLTSRQKLWLLIEKPNSSRMAWVWAACVSLVVIVSSLSLCTLSMEPWREAWRYIYLLEVAYWLELVSYLFVAVEMSVYFILCQNWRELHWVEFASFCLYGVNGVFFSILFPTTYHSFPFKWLTIARLTRVLRVCTNIEEFHIIHVTLRTSGINMKIFVSMYMFITVIFGVMFYADSMFGEWPPANVFYNMCTAIITAITVGYGQMNPITAVEKILSGLCALSGIFTMSILIGCIVKRYGVVYECYKSVKAHIRMLQRLAPEGEMIRLRVNDPTVLMTLNGWTYSFKDDFYR